MAAAGTTPMEGTAVARLAEFAAAVAARPPEGALDDARQAATLTALVRTSWEQRFGLVGIG